MGASRKRKALLAGIAVAVALVSILLCGRLATSPSFHAHTLASLSEKQTTVLELTAAANTASAAITLLPGDAATPIADKLADLGGDFLIVLCAIYLEKFLLLITAYAAFYFLLPLACLLYLLHLLAGWQGCQALGRRLFLFGLLIVLVIPVSVKVSDLIEATYQDSIAATLEAAKDTAQKAESSDTEQSFLSKITEGITSAASGLAQQAGQTVNRFLESLAVMLVTSCVIPVLVLLFLLWLLKAALSLPFSVRETAAQVRRIPRPSGRKKAGLEARHKDGQDFDQS